MSTPASKSMFRRGLREGFPFVLVISPFSMLFGVVATEAGLDITQTFSMSVLIIAGAAQFAAIQQMVDNAPVFMVLATSLAVNLRMAMYSASFVPHVGQAPLWKRAFVAYFLIDQTGVLGANTFDAEPERSVAEKLAYFFGVAFIIAPFWYAGTLFGVLVGGSIPESFALDFAMPITFMAMIAPAVKTLAHLAAAAVSVILALALSWMPYGSGILVAGVAAMATGALVELALERRRVQ